MGDLIDAQAQAALEALAGVRQCWGGCGMLLQLRYTSCFACAVRMISSGQLILQSDENGSFVVVSCDSGKLIECPGSADTSST